MTKQKGFTLIELVVVIVILGILAVTAAPRFLNLQSDARASSLQGLKGAMAGAGSIVFGKAAIEGVEAVSKDATTAPEVDGITTHYGYPTADADGIEKAVDGLTSDWESVSGTVSGAAYTFKGQDSDDYTNSNGCYVTYNEAASSSASPVITVVNEGTNAC
jgi:MSHA pilin protein MshA